MRLIDADALDAELGVSDRDIYVRECLEDAPSVCPLEWIPVSERMPEFDFEDVLVCLKDRRHGCESDYYVAQAHRVRGHWSMVLNPDTNDLKVVAWMPLPKAYEVTE